MPLSTGRGKLFNGLKVLRVKWQRVQGVWHDSVSRDFGEKVWTPLEDEVQSALRATDRLDQILGELFRECGDREY